jgi:Protein of unknown function (DUF1236)
MNKSKLMMAAVATSFIAGMGAALAQQEPPRGTPAEKIAPKAPGSAHEVAPSTAQSGGVTHNGTADTKKNAAQERGDQNKPGQMQQNRVRETTGQAPQAQPNERREQNRATEDNKGTPGRATEEKKLEPNRASGERKNNEPTVGPGAAASKGNANSVTPEQHTRIHEVFVKERSTPRVDHVDFSLSVGTAVPRSVRVITVPQSIVEIQPTWRGYEYFMVGNQIVIVDPRSMEIVAVLDA